MTTSLTKYGRTCAILFLSVQLAACQNLRLYSEKRNQQGIDAKAAWEKVDLNAMISRDRSDLNRILEAQLDLQDRYAIFIRDQKLRGILASKGEVGEVLPAEISAALANLVGKGDSNDIDAAIAFYLESTSKDAEMVQARMRFHQAGAEVPACKDFEFKKNGNEDFEVIKPVELVNLYGRLNSDPDTFNRQRTALARGIALLSAACTKGEVDPYGGFAKLQGGDIQDAIKDMNDDKAELALAKSEGARLKREFDAASEAYKKAVIENPGSGATGQIPVPVAAGEAGTTVCVKKSDNKLQSTQKEVVDAAYRLCQVVSQIENVNNAFGKKFLSEERLDSLQKLVDTINQTQSGDPVPADANKLTKAYILLPNVVDEVRTAIASKKKPAAMSLLIQQDIDRLRLDAATREIALLETRVKLSRLVVDEIAREGVLLNKARTNLKKNESLLAKRMETVFETATPDEKLTLYAALTNYADALGRYEPKWRKARAQRLSTYHEVALVYAEVNLKQWNSLIGTSVQQVNDSAAQGIKSESITNILNTLGILYIGHGVNK
jgi:hypothetical protein